MRRIRLVRTAFPLAQPSTRQVYVCRACLAQSSNPFSTLSTLYAELPFYKRIQESLFGSKESKRAAESREAAQTRRSEATSKRERGAPLEKKTDRWGRNYEVAELIEPSTHKDYIASQTWDGVDRVGSEAWVKARADQGEVYRGFSPARRARLSDAQWRSLLHHIAVEALTLQKAGRDMREICLPRRAKSSNVDHTAAARISADNGDLQFSTEDAETLILSRIPKAANLGHAPEKANDPVRDTSALSHVGSDSAISAGAAASHVGSELAAVTTKHIPLAYKGDAWMRLPIHDSSLKLTMLKRTMQLTGHRIPDSAINDCTTISELWRALKTKEQPKKLFLAPQIQQIKSQIPNVSVHGRRRTPIHREREIGRWKLIEDELIMRNLPVTGSLFKRAKEGLRNDGL